MSKHLKKYEKSDEFRKVGKALNDYQIRHNIIRKDYEELLILTKNYQNNDYHAILEIFYSSHRSCDRF